MEYVLHVQYGGTFFSDGWYPDLALHKKTPPHFKANQDQNISLGLFARASQEHFLAQ